MSRIEFVNCGAVDENGERVPTKAKLKELVGQAARAIADGDEVDAESIVMFDQTSMVMSGRIPGTATVNDLLAAPAETHLQVVGPDPYSRRNWYATVKVARGGKVTVS
jgi:hypothetical protein